MALQPLVRDFARGAGRANGHRDSFSSDIGWVEREAEGDEIDEGRMEEDTELEEGETVEETPRDLDVRFSYLDSRLEQVLGDCQKEFEGSLFADKLGSKIGIYGSFLPTQVRRAPVLTGPPQAPAGVPPRSRLLDERGRRVSSNGFTAVPDRSAKVSPNGTGVKAHPQMNGINHSADGHASNPVKGNKRKGSGPITVRINLNKGGNQVEKNAIYNGFGLDNSSSPSTDADPEGASSASDESSPDRSPCSMIRAITSYIVPGGGILSPLSNVLSEPPDRKEKPLLSAKGSKRLATGSSAVKEALTAKSDNDIGKDAKVVKEKIDKVKGKPGDRREAPPLLDSGKVVKKELENDGRTGKDGGGNGPKVFHKVAAKDGTKDLDLKGEKIDRDVDVRDGVGKQVDTLKDSGRSSRKEKVFTLDVTKDDGPEFPDTLEVRKAREEGTKALKKSRETSVEPNLKEIPVKEPSKEKRKMGGNKDTMRAKREEEAPQKDFQKQQYRKDVGRFVEPVVVERDTATDGSLEIKKRGKESSKGPRMHKETKDKAQDAVKDARRESKKESSKKDVLRDVDDSGKEEPKESSKLSVRDIPKEPPRDVGKLQGADQASKDLKAGKKGGKKGGKEPKLVGKEMERDTGAPASLLGPVADGTGVQPPALHPLLMPTAGPVADSTAGTILPSFQPVLVKDHWVQCDNCQQWRLLSPNVNPEDLPEKWLCKMMDWLPGLNNCKHTEEVTTAAVYELLGLQNPQLNPALQAQQQVLAPGLAPPAGLVPDIKMLASKPVKVSRSGSKKGMGKRVAAGTVRNTVSNVKRVEANAVKSKSLNDVGQHPGDHVAKRKKKPESSEENDELRAAKKSRVDETRNRRSIEANARRRGFDDLDNHSQQYASDEGAGQEGESGDRGGGNIRNVARGTSSGQAFKRVKVTSTTTRDILEGGHRNSFEKLERTDSEKEEYRREDPGRCMKDKEVNGKVKPREGDGKPDSKWRVRGDDIESGHQGEKRRLTSKPELKEWGASREILREEKSGQIKRVGISPRTESQQHDLIEEHSREAYSPRIERVEDTVGRNGRLFDEISGIARTYAPVYGRADESPNGESPLPGAGNYHEQAGQQKGGSQLRSPPSSSSKVSDSAESSAFGSKGGSPIESTVSSSPQRSFKVDGVGTGRGISKGLQNNHTSSHSHPSDKMNSVSPSPKRSIDQEADTHSDREGAPRQSHRNWDDRPHSSEPEREFRGPGRDPGRDSASGRGRDDRYATCHSREGADFRKYDRSRGGRDDDRYWEEGRETRAGSASYFAERGYDRHRDERYREREDSVDRYRDRYERRSSREDRFREKERDSERARSRENWANDRGGDVREERYSRERSVRPDRGGRPSSRESRLDKQGGWHDESRLVRDVGRDDNPETKHETTSNHVEGLKDDHPGEDEHEAAPDVQKDDAGRRHEKMDLGPSKDPKPSFLRAPPSGQGSHGWEGDKVGGAFSGRKDSDAGASRNGLEAQAMTTHVNSRTRVDVMQSGQGSTGVRGKPGQVDGAPLDVRIVEDTKQGKEHKKAADEISLWRVSAQKALTTRSTEGASSSLSVKEHLALGKTLVQEGQNLKHSADRLKTHAATEVETPNLYFQASLKFLQGAHHYEMASEGGRPDGLEKSITLYNQTAQFFEFCAGIYERKRDHAGRALAFICASVARFRAVKGKSDSLSKDCTELKNAASSAAGPGSQVVGVLTPPMGLPPPPPPPARTSEKPRSSHGVGVVSTVEESPSSSSASDVDDLNNLALTGVGDKGLAANAVKGVAPSPTVGYVSGSAELVPQHAHEVYHRMLKNVMEVGTMMESWTKAQNATAAAEAAYAGVPGEQEGMAAVRRVVELGLLANMDVVVRQVRIALEAIAH